MSLRKHGWFAIPGIQTGEREIKERVLPLKYLLRHAKGATILDVGSAEGCISKWLIDEGKAKSAHLLEKHQPFLDTARDIMPPDKYHVRFTQGDLFYWDETKADMQLEPGGYDIVLALNVIQKIKKPRELLHDLAGLANRYFVYSGPDSVLKDARSNMDPVDIRKELQKDFEVVDFHAGVRDQEKGHLGVRIIFKRRGTK